MKINEIIHSTELYERYYWNKRVRRPVPVFRPTPRIGPVIMSKPQPIPKPLPVRPQIVKKPKVQVNKKPSANLDFMKGPEFKRNDYNPVPPMTDNDKKIYGIDQQKKSSF